MSELTLRVAENAANMGMLAASLIKDGKIKVESQINLAQDIAHKAQYFERQYDGWDWSETGDKPSTLMLKNG